MQLTGTVGDTTYTLTVDEGGPVDGPAFLVNAFKDIDGQGEEAVLRHARKLFGESLKIDRGLTAPPEGRKVTDEEARMVAQGTPNQPDIGSPAQAQIDAKVKATEEPQPEQAPQTATDPAGALRPPVATSAQRQAQTPRR